MPNIMMTPIIDVVESVVSVRKRIRITPGKPIGTENMMVRVEGVIATQNIVYIVNGAQQKVWISTNDMWVEVSEQFGEYWNDWRDSLEAYEDTLEDWTGTGDYSYTLPSGDSMRIYNIQVNPALADSLFTH